MEPIGEISEGEWGCLSGTYTAEEANFMSQLLNNNSSIPTDQNGLSSYAFPSIYWHGIDSSSTLINMPSFCEISIFPSDSNSKPNFHRFSERNNSFSDSNSNLFPISPQENYFSNDPIPPPDLFSSNNSSYQIQGSAHNESAATDRHDSSDVAEKNVQPKSESEMIVTAEENSLLDNSKKRSRVSIDVQRTKRNLKTRKSQKLTSTSHNEDDGNAGHNSQSTSSYCSEDESNASQELTNSSLSPKGGEGNNSNGKTRASRGSATDPQSLYARKRRERINERLRILQGLVPNGTKVDISTMLEEAVQYVKFLQLQIKLLSSDDMWMYAPIAYNGMDIGLITPRHS